MKNTSISWASSTWNPVSGCSEVSPGCDNCYAKAIAERYRGAPAYPNGFDVTLWPTRLEHPIKWTAPKHIFVNSMSDLFHKDIPDEFLAQIWDVMLKADHHIYQILTKRAHRMAHKIKELGLPLRDHIWLGVSVENQDMADSRIPALVGIGSAVPWISAEPLIAPVDLGTYLGPEGLKWVVCGGESGPKRRHMEYDWARAIRDQCKEAGIAFWYKQGNHRRADRDKYLDGKLHQDYPSFGFIDGGEVTEPQVEEHQGALL